MHKNAPVWKKSKNKYTTEMKDPIFSVFTHNALSGSSHGIEMEAMGLLSLLPVICFLFLPVQNPDDDENKDAHANQCYRCQ